MVNLSTFDLNLLRVLDALLREGSTVAAGTRLGLSQPAVSNALGRLRAATGDALFFRQGQGLAPTEYARRLEGPLREHLDAIQTLLNGPRTFDPQTSEARFRISGSDFFAEMLMPQLAGRLAAEAPRMLLHLVDLVPDSYVDTLERYEVDLALIPAIPFPDWVQSRAIFKSTFSVIARRGHPDMVQAGIRPGEAVPIDLFCALGHVLFSPEGKDSAMGDAALARVGRKRRVAMTMPVFSGVYRAVANSDLIALLPTQLARHVAPVVGLEVYSAPMPIDPATITMIWHRRYSGWPPHAWLREQIADLLAPLDETTDPRPVRKRSRIKKD